jgi:hypothetical protein
MQKGYRYLTTEQAERLAQSDKTPFIFTAICLAMPVIMHFLFFSGSEPVAEQITSVEQVTFWVICVAGALVGLVAGLYKFLRGDHRQYRLFIRINPYLLEEGDEIRDRRAALAKLIEAAKKLSEVDSRFHIKDVSLSLMYAEHRYRTQAEGLCVKQSHTLAQAFSSHGKPHPWEDIQTAESDNRRTIEPIEDDPDPTPP